MRRSTTRTSCPLGVQFLFYRTRRPSRRYGSRSCGDGPLPRASSIISGARANERMRPVGTTTAAAPTGRRGNRVQQQQGTRWRRGQRRCRPRIATSQSCRRGAGPTRRLEEQYAAQHVADEPLLFHHVLRRARPHQFRRSGCAAKDASWERRLVTETDFSDGRSSRQRSAVRAIRSTVDVRFAGVFSSSRSARGRLRRWRAGAIPNRAAVWWLGEARRKLLVLELQPSDIAHLAGGGIHGADEWIRVGCGALRAEPCTRLRGHVPRLVRRRRLGASALLSSSARR